jgi:alcohol dehydrogenase class IV
MFDITEQSLSEFRDMTSRFDSPRAIITGGGCRLQAAELLFSMQAHRTLVVVDPFFASVDFVDEIRSALNRQGIATDTFSNFQPDPTDQNVSDGAVAFSGLDADSIVAIGGGSALDVAKMIGAAAANPGPIAQFQGYHRIPKAGPLLVAIPTTAGTGSEATKVAVITDMARNVKMMILDAKLMPTAAIVDYELTFSMPKPLTAHVGVDALTHGIEAYVSRKANPLTDPVALSCITKIHQNLPAAWADPQNAQAREAMSFAALQGGLAFTNSSVCLVHGMSRPLGLVFRLPHGLSNSVLLPTVTRFSWPGAEARYAEIARAIKLASGKTSDDMACEALTDWLDRLNNDLRVPRLRECCGADIDRFRASLKKMATDALESGSPQNNPIVPQVSEIEELFEEAW